MKKRRAEFQSAKVHYTGIPCGCQARWLSCFLTSCKNVGAVTCNNCLRSKVVREARAAAAIAESGEPAAPASHSAPATIAGNGEARSRIVTDQAES